MGRWVRLGAIAAIIVASYWFKIWALTDVGNPNVYFLRTELLNINCLGYLWVFCIGVAAYWEREFLMRFVKGKFLSLLAIYLGVALSVLAIRGKSEFAFGLTWPLHWTDALIVALLGLLTFAAAFAKNQYSSILRSNDISYGVYLYHMPVFLWFSHAGWTGTWQQSALAIGVTILFSFLSWKLVEKNFLRFKLSRPNRENVRAT